MGAVRGCRVPRPPARHYTGRMTTLHIEHSISDFDLWKTMFDRAEDLRAECRVRAYDIHQPADDHGYVTIRVELDTPDDARLLLSRLETAWADRTRTPALRGKPVTRILERRAQRTY
jgi:hypothetical protein